MAFSPTLSHTFWQAELILGQPGCPTCTVWSMYGRLSNNWLRALFVGRNDDIGGAVILPLWNHGASARSPTDWCNSIRAPFALEGGDRASSSLPIHVISCWPSVVGGRWSLGTWSAGKSWARVDLLPDCGGGFEVALLTGWLGGQCECSCLR